MNPATEYDKIRNGILGNLQPNTKKLGKEKNMRFQPDHDLHIHSYLSSCSKNPLQNPEAILDYAEKNNLKTVCITDHYWDSASGDAGKWYATQNFDHISKILPLPKRDGINLLFGCEGDMNKDLVVGVPCERHSAFDFMVIPTTHMHMKGFAIHEEDFLIAERCAKLWVERLDALLSSPLPFHKVGIAHLACYLINKKSDQDYLHTLDLIPDDEMHRLFEKAAKLRVGIELNQDDMRLAAKHGQTVLRPFRIAKEEGCKFYLGSDSHHPEEFTNALHYFNWAIDALGLTEDDKIDFLRS